MHTLSEVRAFSDILSPGCPILYSSNPEAAAHARSEFVLMTNSNVVLEVGSPTVHDIKTEGLDDSKVDPERIMACLQKIKDGKCRVLGRPIA